MESPSLTSTMFQTQEFPSPTVKSLPSPSASFISPADVDFIKEECTASVTSGDPCADASSSTSAPKKKRKSWGQVLPLPTTNLPPRKRAKTDAEKEQRRYERVQRNRAAAHASRMRKQEETDHLRAENNRLIQDNTDLRQQLERLNEVVASLQKGLNYSGADRLPTPPQYENTPLVDDKVPSLTSNTPHTSPSSASINTPPPSYNDIPLFAKQSDGTHSAVDIGFDLANHGQETEGVAKNAQIPMMDMTNFMNMMPATEFGSAPGNLTSINAFPTDMDFNMGDFLNLEGADFSSALATDTASDALTASNAVVPDAKMDFGNDSNLLNTLLDMDQFESSNP